MNVIPFQLIILLHSPFSGKLVKDFMGSKDFKTILTNPEKLPLHSLNTADVFSKLVARCQAAVKKNMTKQIMTENKENIRKAQAGPVAKL